MRKPIQEADIFEKRSEQNSVHCLSDRQKATFEGTHYSFEELASQDTECLNGSGHASLTGDPDDILDLAGQVQRNDPGLGQSLNSLAGDFQFDKILK